MVENEFSVFGQFLSRIYCRFRICVERSPEIYTLSILRPFLLEGGGGYFFNYLLIFELDYLANKERSEDTVSKMPQGGKATPRLEFIYRPYLIDLSKKIYYNFFCLVSLMAAGL